MNCGFVIRSKQVCSFEVLGDYKSPGLIGRTFFYGGLQIRRDAWRETLWNAWRETLWNAWRGSNPPGRLAGMKYDKMQRGTLQKNEACLFFYILMG